MIPRAVEQVFRVTEDLKRKGWIYRMEGQFLEIVSLPFCLASFSNVVSVVQRDHQRLARQGRVRQEEARDQARQVRTDDRDGRERHRPHVAEPGAEPARARAAAIASLPTPLRALWAAR